MRFLPSFSPLLGRGLPQSQKTTEINNLREQLLSILLYGATALGLVIYFISIRSTFVQQEWKQIIFYTAVYGWLITITFYRRLSYYLRAGSLIGLLYMLGTVVSIQNGLVGDGRLWMLGFTMLTAIFLGPQLNILATLLGGVTLVGIGWGVNQDLISSQALFHAPMSSWLLTSLTFLVVSLILGGTAGYLLANLAERLEKERDITNELEYEREELRERTTDLERSHIQLQTTAEISQAITSELDPDIIFPQTVTLLTERFGLYYAGIFILDEDRQYAVLQAGSGEAGQIMLAERHRLAASENSMIGWTIINKQARINLDVGEDAIRFDNPHLPLTRSELAIPIISRGRVWGALTIQSTEPQAFSENDITILQTMADNLASAVENAQLYQQSQSNLEEIRTLHRQYLQQAWQEVTQSRADLKHIFVNKQPTSLEGEISTIEVPLTLRGQQIGNLVLETNNPNLTAEEKNILDALTTQAALALENARLLEITQQRSQRDRIISELTSKVQRATKVDEALKTTLQELGQALGASEGMIYLEISE